MFSLFGLFFFTGVSQESSEKKWMPGKRVDCLEKSGSLHDFSLQMLETNETMNLKDLKGKVVLLVNVATF